MATSKKKTEKLGNIPANGWPKIEQGSHLTVKTFEDGRTELVWDWDALVNEVREACASAELAGMKPSVKAKVATRKKKEKAQ